MSKIGQVNFELQEQANELGFETVQEALDNGYVVGTELFGDAPRLIKPIDMQKELEEAHKAWLKEKEKVLEDLNYLAKVYDNVNPDMYIIKRTIDFIEKGEV